MGTPHDLETVFATPKNALTQNNCSPSELDISITIADENRPRLVIVGGGFAGLHLAQHLKTADLQIVLLDRNNFHTF